MEHLPLGPYDLAECDDGPDPIYDTWWRVICKERDLTCDTQSTIDQYDGFETEDEAQAFADKWTAEAEDSEGYHYYAYIEEYEVERLWEPYDQDDWDD